MLLLYCFGVIVSIATVGGFPMDFNEGEYTVEGFIPNDTPVDSPGELPPYVYPAELNPDPLGEMRDNADVDSFRALEDEPRTETTNQPTNQPNNEPANQPNSEPTNDADNQSSNPPTTVLIEFDNSVTLSSSCNRYFGLACCTGNSYEAINIANAEPLHLQDVSGCSAHDATTGACNAGLYCCFQFPAVSPFYKVENIGGSQCYSIPSQADIPAINSY